MEGYGWSTMAGVGCPRGKERAMGLVAFFRVRKEKTTPESESEKAGVMKIMIRNFT